MHKKYNQIDKTERFEIDYLLNKKRYSVREIARILERSPSTISREIQRNKLQKIDQYKSKQAHHKSYVRKKYSKFKWKKINEDKILKKYIIEKLEQHWNPAEISGRMKIENLPFYASKTAIYDWLRSDRGQRYCKHLYSQRYYVKKRRKKTKREMVPLRIGIEYRPEEANERSELGHYEVDTIVSGRSGTGAISVMVDMKSRECRLVKLKTMRPSEHLEVLEKNIEYFGNVKTLTFDNGIENKHHYKLNTLTFFCDPYSSWQKGTVENINKMVRRYLPKGTDLSKIPQRYLDGIAKRINKKPREILGFYSALEVSKFDDIIDIIDSIINEGVALRG